MMRTRASSSVTPSVASARPGVTAACSSAPPESSSADCPEVVIPTWTTSHTSSLTRCVVSCLCDRGSLAKWCSHPGPRAQRRLGLPPAGASRHLEAQQANQSHPGASPDPQSGSNTDKSPSRCRQRSIRRSSATTTAERPASRFQGERALSCSTIHHTHSDTATK